MGDFDCHQLSDCSTGPFEARPKPRKDADLAAMDGDNTPVPGGSGRAYRHGEIARQRDQQAPYGQTLGGYTGSGQRACQPAKED